MSVNVKQRISFDFFGLRCDIIVPTQVDVEHFLYYFSHFHCCSDPPDLEIRLEVEQTGMSFVGGLLEESVEKRIFVKEGEKPLKLYDRFANRSNRPSPIPPFGFAPLRDSLHVIHGASIVSPNGDSILMIGGSFSGKSVLTLEMLHRGWRFQSDDLTILTKNSLETLAFPRPIGVREKTFEILQWLNKDRQNECGRRFLISNQWTWMVTATELFGECGCDRAQLRGVCILNNFKSATECVLRETSPVTIDEVCFWKTPSKTPQDDQTAPGISFYKADYCIETHTNQLADLLEDSWRD